MSILAVCSAVAAVTILTLVLAWSVMDPPAAAAGLVLALLMALAAVASTG